MECSQAAVRTRGIESRIQVVASRVVRFPAARWVFSVTGLAAGVILSPRPATKTSPSPALIARAAALTAARPEEQRRVYVTPRTEGRGPARSAARPRPLPLSPPPFFARAPDTPSPRPGFPPPPPTTPPPTRP